VRAGSFNTTGRGRLLVDADRSEPVPGSGPIADTCVYKLALCQLAEYDTRRIRQWVRFAVSKILDPDETLCRQHPRALREAVQYLERREPRMAVCESCWGACALLSRSLGYRRQRPRKEQRTVRASAGSARERRAVTTNGGGDVGRGDSGERGVRDGGEGGVEDGGGGGVRGSDGSGGGGTHAEAAHQQRFLAHLPWEAVSINTQTKK